MTTPTMPDVFFSWAPDARVEGYVLDDDAVWARPPGTGAQWHLVPLWNKTLCGRAVGESWQRRWSALTYPWPDRSCWQCMSVRWKGGVR